MGGFELVKANEFAKQAVACSPDVQNDPPGDGSQQTRQWLPNVSIMLQHF